MAKASAKVVDFSNVKEGGGSFNKRRVPAGDYVAKVVKVEDAESKSDGVFQYLFTIKLNKYSQYAYPYYCKLHENQLWKLRNLLVAAGLAVPKKRMKLDPSKVVGKVVGVTMEDDEYEGKLQSVVQSIFPASELDANDIVDEDEPEEDEEVEDEDIEDEDDEAEDDDVEEGDEFDAMDRDELKAYIKGNDPDARIKKSQSDDDLREVARSQAPAEEEEDEDDEEEEPEPPKKAKKAKAKKAATIDDDDLEDLDIEDL